MDRNPDQARLCSFITRQKAMPRILLLAAAAALLSACATSPLGRSQLSIVSDDQMAQVGAQAFQQIAQKTPVTQNLEQSRYVVCVANAITTAIPGNNTPWEVRVFESNEINAFALPGGHIGVYTGLLKVATTQDQLGAVLGHEVSHVLAHHSAERYSQQMAADVGSEIFGAFTGVDPRLIGGAAGLVLLRFSRTQESEADLLGLDLMSRAGFDPHGAIALWQNMEHAAGGGKPPEILSTHPSDVTRIQQLQERLPQDLPLYQQAHAARRQPHCG
jgi:predicted Zn-dependent protease